MQEPVERPPDFPDMDIPNRVLEAHLRERGLEPRLEEKVVHTGLPGLRLERGETQVLKAEGLPRVYGHVEINAHLQDGDNQENPYVETVNRGFDYMFTGLTSSTIGVQTYGNPDTNLNGIGIGVNSGRPIYEGGMVMDAIASSNNPRGFATTGDDDE